MFFGFDSLVQAFIVAASNHQASGKFVNNNDFPVFYNIVHIPNHDAMCANGLVNMVLQCDVLRIRQIVNMKIFLCFFNASLGQGSGFCLFIDDIVALNGVVILFVIKFFDLCHFQPAHKTVHLGIHVRRFVPRAGDNQRGTRLVDKNGVDLVNNAEVEGPLDTVFLINDHVVTQVVKTDFIIGTIGDVGIVSLPALFVVQSVHNQANF